MGSDYDKVKTATVIAVSAALTLAACGGGANGSRSSATPSPPPAGDRLSVDKAAAFQGFTTVAAVFTNHSQRRVATSISVEATAYGRDNATVVGRSVPGVWSVSMLHAGQSLPVAITIDKTGGGPINRVSFHTAVGAWFNDANPKAGIKGSNLTVTPLPTSSPGASAFRLTAAIVNGYPRDLQMAPISAICEDHDGKITSAGWNYVGLLPANGEAGVSIEMQGEAPASPSSCQVAGRPASPLEGG